MRSVCLLERVRDIVRDGGFDIARQDFRSLFSKIKFPIYFVTGLKKESFLYLSLSLNYF